jgi:hypothetical protein
VTIVMSDMFSPGLLALSRCGCHAGRVLAPYL